MEHIERKESNEREKMKEFIRKHNRISQSQTYFRTWCLSWIPKTVQSEYCKSLKTAKCWLNETTIFEITLLSPDTKFRRKLTRFQILCTVHVFKLALEPMNLIKAGLSQRPAIQLGTNSLRATPNVPAAVWLDMKLLHQSQRSLFPPNPVQRHDSPPQPSLTPAGLPHWSFVIASTILESLNRPQSHYSCMHWCFISIWMYIIIMDIIYTLFYMYVLLLWYR